MGSNKAQQADALKGVIKIFSFSAVFLLEILSQRVISYSSFSLTKKVGIDQ